MTEEFKAAEETNDSAKISRRSRATDNRAFESRTVDDRPPIVWNKGSRFNVPDSVLRSDEDHDYSYVVYSSGNIEQKENYYDAIERHYKPVAASEHPDLARNYELNPFGSRDEGESLIRKGGQVLMKRRKEYGQAEKSHYDSEIHRQHYMAEMYKQQDPRYPKPFMDDRSTPGRRG